MENPVRLLVQARSPIVLVAMVVLTQEVAAVADLIITGITVVVMVDQVS
jgi:hypothetical protein